MYKIFFQFLILLFLPVLSGCHTATKEHNQRIYMCNHDNMAVSYTIRLDAHCIVFFALSDSGGEVVAVCTYSRGGAYWECDIQSGTFNDFTKLCNFIPDLIVYVENFIVTNCYPKLPMNLIGHVNIKVEWNIVPEDIKEYIDSEYHGKTYTPYFDCDVLNMCKKLHKNGFPFDETFMTKEDWVPFEESLTHKEAYQGCGERLVLSLHRSNTMELGRPVEKSTEPMP